MWQRCFVNWPLKVCNLRATLNEGSMK
jgi:hypothetical protein